MHVLVTGCAGFIGSHLCERLLDDGHQVSGVDHLAGPSYSPAIKEKNMLRMREHGAFRFFDADLASSPLEPLLEGVDLIYHLAGQPGVRDSWGEDFPRYLERNVAVTQRLLEALRRRPDVKVVLASTSSVYGAVPLPFREAGPAIPLSPYGCSKLAAEHLFHAYRRNFGIAGCVARFFTVYGPRQRPDMGFHRFIQSVAEGRPIRIFGDGSQSRDFTFVGDAVEALVRLGRRPLAGETLNVARGRERSLLDALALIERIVGKKAAISFESIPPGDPSATLADVSELKRFTDFSPATELETGLAEQIAWQLG